MIFYRNCCFQLSNVVTWSPGELIDASDDCGNGLAVVLLNRPILLHKEYFRSIWNSGKVWHFQTKFQDHSTNLLLAKVRITVDGGTNRWVDFVKEHPGAEHDLKPPELVTGDFDSCTDESLSYVTRLNCRVKISSSSNCSKFLSNFFIPDHKNARPERNRLHQIP